MSSIHLPGSDVGHTGGGGEVYDETWPAYSTTVEIFVALRDVDYHFSVNENCPVRTSRQTVARKVVAYTKPPGSLQWIQKCTTETIFRQKSPIFSTKLCFQSEKKDAGAILIKFEVHDVFHKEIVHAALLGSVEVKLETLINAGSTGLELPIFPLTEPYKQKSRRYRNIIQPGRLFLRAEILQILDYAVLLKLGLRRSSPKCFFRPSVFPYYFEIYKLNEQTLFEITHPYTLIHRSELINHAGGEDDCWNYTALPVSRICNGDMGRVLKLEVYQADHPNTPKGFALTNLRKMLIERELVIPITRLDGKLSNKICLYAPLCHEVALHPFHYYLNKGLTLRRIYAVDYSNSNWNIQLHKRSLHDINSGRTPYEEAIIMAAGAIIDAAQGDSVFFGFGSTQMEQYITTLGQDNHIRSLLTNYKEALYGAQMAMSCENTQLSSSGILPESNMNNIQSVSSSDWKSSTCLTPVLNDISSLVSLRAETFDYHLVFIFTDGQISDIESSMQVILNLAKLPVSIIFIGIGMGDLHQLLSLEKEWAHPVTGEFPCRKLIHVIHFRSLVEWDSAIKILHYKSQPADLFRKEIFTPLREQLPGFMRIFRTAI